MSDDPFLDRIQKAANARQRIVKLMAMYDRHPNTEEGKSAKRKAEELARKHNVSVNSEAVPSFKIAAGAFAAFGAAIRKNYPGQIDESDLVKPNRRVVDKEDDDDEEQY